MSAIRWEAAVEGAGVATVALLVVFVIVLLAEWLSWPVALLIVGIVATGAAVGYWLEARRD